MSSENTILKLSDNLIVPIQTELHDYEAANLQIEILKRIETDKSKGLIIDISAVVIVDSFLGRLIGETAKMARLMGTATVLVGMRKEVVMTLLQLGMQISELFTALTLEDGLSLLTKIKKEI